MTTIRVFTGSPGDMREERDIVSIVVDELQRTVAPLIPVELEAIRWETHSVPGVGEDAQDVINGEIGDYDVFVGIMWKRFGTRTKSGGSGTADEFERAYRYFKDYGRPKIMFYFRTTKFFTTDLREYAQFRKVLAFRKKLEKYGVLFWEYDEPIDFERRFRQHLTKQIQHLRDHAATTSSAAHTRLFFSYKREDLERVEPVYEALKAAGFAPWMDVRDILPGGQWIPEIKSAIASSEFFLTFVSHNTVQRHVRSATGFSVPTEIGIALGKLNPKGSIDNDHAPDPRSYFIPVRLDPVDPPSNLARFQWVDLFDHKGLERLVETIRKVWAERR